MRRNYKFFDKEEIDPRIIRYEFDPPFYENLDQELKEIYGEELTFVKEINHRDQIIRIHSGYDSGKGTRYVPPKPRKKPREKIDFRLKRILENQETNVLELQMEGEENLILNFREKVVTVYRDANFRNGTISGYFMTRFEKDRAFKFLLGRKYYPETFTYHKV